jgi:hypothetical protein
LKFWASAEVHQPASDAMTKARRCVESFLSAAFAASSLAKLVCELRYVPIIMPEGMRERYPARSKLRKNDGVYVCAPQLNYEVFVDGKFEDQLKEYLNGIAPSAPHLAGLGATKQQIKDFEEILASAAGRILAEQSDQTRH